MGEGVFKAEKDLINGPPGKPIDWEVVVRWDPELRCVIRADLAQTARNLAVQDLTALADSKRKKQVFTVQDLLVGPAFRPTFAGLYYLRDRVCQVFDITEDEFLMGPKPTKTVSLARKVYFAAARNLTNCSLAEIRSVVDGKEVGRVRKKGMSDWVSWTELKEKHAWAIEAVISGIPSELIERSPWHD